MSIVNGVVGQQTLTGKTVIDDRHPAVVCFKKFKQDNGIIPAGEIVAADTNGDMVSYDPLAADSTNTPKGVCTQETDTSKNTISGVMIHGAVVAKALLTKGAAATAGEISDLESNTVIWSF